MAAKPQLYSIDDFEQYAAEYLPKTVRDYFNGGALDSVTLNANRAAYSKWYIRPRVLRDVSKLKPQRRVFHDGHEIRFPCCVAPAAMQKMAHPDGEEATARGCGAYGTAMGLSSFSTTSLEDAKKQADAARHASGKTGDSECVMQMYLFENRATTDDLVWRAEKAGYKAIVLTVDTPYFGRRLTEIRNRFKLPSHLKMANFPESLGVKTGSHHRTEELSKGGSSTTTTSSTPANKNDPSLTWDVIPYLKSMTKLPIWLKGILTPEDALLASASYMVWIGRPALWAIAYDGEAGLVSALHILEDEFRACMALAGCSTLDELTPDLLMRVDSKL
ncbi:Hydroxyacid oxidase 1 [Sporothrix eucalyptigena]|uniref:Hydroxyacid oxidase 1 n=1 Tax=Sporothrix eucalyptigena TaxID=1812306 RepID=A0ABP0C183_9PEZI